MTISENLVAGLRTITEAHARIDQPRSTLAALDGAIADVVGRKLLTVLAVHTDKGIVSRAYSNVSDSYAVGGTKRIDSAPRLQRVLATGQPFIGRNKADIVANFADAETILATGCSSILNVPVFWMGKILATVNLLHTEGYYQDEHVPIVRCLAQAALPAFLCAEPARAEA
ncbi:GAF domain-containing protein [Burkholderia ambifaria]|uniref:GAF domain-containing protein n=1 Tax=Burkholderia ambifaria TaxID=152480 RepID=UPI000F805F1A|nr:GAF domain-containing protein [Burkholderia ambifaria]